MFGVSTENEKKYKRRSNYGGQGLLPDLKFQEVSCHYTYFTRMSSVDFEILVNLVGPKIQKSDTREEQ